MGGSFNPPTIAHLKIMQLALDAVNAEQGLMVPVSFPYLKRKMAKAGQSHLALSDELRVRLLEATTASDRRIQIFTGAMGSPYSDDVGLMKKLQDQRPDARFYYVAGADKLVLLENFAGKCDFFDSFRCILFARDGGRLIEEISKRERLAPYLDAFVLLDTPVGIDGISSTRVRENLFDIESAKSMVSEEVFALLRGLKREDFPEEILQFKDEYAFLSNDFPAASTSEGLTYPCATSAYLASKCDKFEDKRTISTMGIEKAKRKYGGVVGRGDWENRKIDVMESIVRQKFRSHPELMEKLISTGFLKLINGGKRDTFWGVNLITWEGENWLGKILMKVRSEGRTL